MQYLVRAIHRTGTDSGDREARRDRASSHSQTASTTQKTHTPSDTGLRALHARASGGACFGRTADRTHSTTAAHQISQQRSSMEPVGDESTDDETADETVGQLRARRSGGSDTRIRAACGTVVRCSEGASRLSGFVKRWLDELGEAQTEDGPDRLFQLQPGSCISALTLRCLIAELEHTATHVKTGGCDQATGARETSVDFETLAAADFFALYRAARFLECDHLELRLALHLASRLRGKTPRQIRYEFSIAADLSDQRQRDSLSESVLKSPTEPRPDAAAPGGALACGAPQLARSLSFELGDEGAIFDCLGAADVQTMITLKGVSMAWRERARTALTDVACSSWRTSAAVRGEAWGRLELRMIEMHQRQALARLDACVVDDCLPPGLTDRKGMHDPRRVFKELRRVADSGENAKDNIDCHVLSISPVGDISCVHAELLGPQGTSYAGGVFKIELEFPAGYPMQPPTARFVTPIYHPNIERVGGKVSLDILQDRWTPALTLRTTVLSVGVLLSMPNFDQPVEPELAALFREDPAKYEQEAREFTRAHAWPGKYN